MRENPTERAAVDAAEARAYSRREVLKLGAAAAAAASVGYVAGRSRHAEAAAAPAVRDVPGAVASGGGAQFAVDIPGCPVASANVVSVQVEDLTVDVREMATGMDVEYRVYAPGDAHYGNATFRSRVGHTSKELQAWFLDAAAGKDARKSISVICLKRDGSEARRYNLMECFPVKFDPGDYSPSSTTAVESITVKIGRVEFKV